MTGSRTTQTSSPGCAPRPSASADASSGHAYRPRREAEAVARAAIAVEPCRRLLLIAFMPAFDYPSTPTPWDILGWLGLRRGRFWGVPRAPRFAPRGPGRPP